MLLSFLGIFIFVLLLLFVYSLLYLNAISYSVTNTEFGLKGGIIARFEKVLPYSKIQHAIIIRSLMQRIMGLSTLVIQTASPQIAVSYSRNRNQDPFAGSPRIPGLDVENAEKLRDYIIAQVLRSKSGQGI
jgi:membrane protein YdbS with pleckstrin-like domain